MSPNPRTGVPVAGVGVPAATAAARWVWFASASSAAQIGTAALVPPAPCQPPAAYIASPVPALAATSGVSLIVETGNPGLTCQADRA